MTDLLQSLVFFSRQAGGARALIARRKRQKGDVARSSDRAGQHPLMGRARPGQPAGQDLAPVGDELPDQFHVLVINHIDLFVAEFTHFPATEVLLPGPGIAPFAARRALSLSRTSSRGGHYLWLPFA